MIHKRMRNAAQRVFFGWWIVTAGIGLQTLISGLMIQSYGAYVVFLSEEFGWSKTALSSVYGLKQLQTGLMSPLQGYVLERFGSRRVVRLGVFVFAFGLFALSQVQNLWTFALVFLFIGIGTSLCGLLSLLTTVVNWFERRRSTALSTMQLGMGIGGLLVPVVAWSLAYYGWRNTAWMSGVLVLLFGLPLSRLIRSQPEDYGLLPDGAVPEPDAADALASDTPTSDKAATAAPSTSAQATSRPVRSQATGFTPRQALRTRAFWFISFGHAAAVLIVSAVTVHLVAHLTEGLGYSVQAAASVVALMTLMSMLGQVIGGILGDLYSKRLLTTVAMVGHASAIAVLAVAQSNPAVWYFAVVHGVSWGVRGPLMGAIRADYFGRQAFARIMGMSSLIITIGTLGGPVFAGYMADRFGNYQASFLILAVIAALSSLFFAFAHRPVLPTALPPLCVAPDKQERCC